MIDTVLASFGTYFPEINAVITTGLYIFARLMGFLRFAPVFNRKEIPGMIKISIMLIFAVILVMVLKPVPIPKDNSMILSLTLNFVFGAILGFIANCILEIVASAGDMINMQMGMSSAMIMDPTTQSQISIMGKFFAFLGLVIFMSVGGVYWLINAFVHSFDLMPVYANAIPMNKINIDYIILLTSNILFVGLQIAAPVLLATLAQDLILGIISKTAPQINVFQLSFLFKPLLGSAILVWVFPIFINVISDYFISFAKIL